MIESEKTLEKKLGTKVKELGGWSLKFTSTFISGLPDRIVLMPGGRIFFAEIKTTKQKPRKIQLLMHRKLQALGFKVYVIDTTEQINEILWTERPVK